MASSLAAPAFASLHAVPGATNASIGVHTAYQDSSPMILFIGQIGSDVVEREAFQEVDYRRMYGQMAKWVAQVDRADRIPEYVSHAFHLADLRPARAGSAGAARGHAHQPSRGGSNTPLSPSETARQPASAEERQARLLQTAVKPFVILGGGDWTRTGMQ